MKYTEIEQFWPIFEAIKAGKIIQTYDKYNDEWSDAKDILIFNLQKEYYRVKPEKKKAKKVELQFNIIGGHIWAVPKYYYGTHQHSTKIGDAFTIYYDIETNQIVNPENLGEYDVSE